MVPKMSTAPPAADTSPNRSRSSSISDDAAADGPLDNPTNNVGDTNLNPSVVASLASPMIKAHPTNTVSYITVSDPILVNDGLRGRHAVYRVGYSAEEEVGESVTVSGEDGEAAADSNIEAETTDQKSNKFLPHPIAAHHRYSSFLTLRGLLSKEKPGAILPPLPDKLIKDRFNPQCLEARRFELEIFLKRCVVHPELRDSPTLKAFFDEAHWGRVKKGDVDVEEELVEQFTNYEEPKVTSKTSTKNTIKKWIKDKKTSLSGTLHRSPLDPLFDEMEHYISALESGLKRVELQTEHMVKNCEREGEMFMEFGLGSDAIGHVDDFIGGTAPVPSNTDKTQVDLSGDVTDRTKQSIGQTFHTISCTAYALSTIHRAHYQTLYLNFLLPLKDHLKLIQSAKSAITKRSNRRITYSTALANVDAKKASLHKYRITQGMENKIINAESSLSKAEAEVEIAKRNYDEVSDRVLREFDRFRNENAQGMHDIMIDFARVQVAFSEEVAKVWNLTHFGKWESSGRCYVEAAKGLMEGSGAISMPMYPPPPVPDALANGMESFALQGSVKYRELPEE